MFWTRLASGVVLVILALILLITGGNVLFGGLLVISLIGITEFYRATGVLKKNDWLLAAMGYLGTIAYYLLLLFEKQSYTMLGMLLILTAFLGVYVLTFPRYRSEQVTAGMFGVLYVSVMLSYIYLTRNLDDGAFLVWLIFICSWGCDTCAYCVGILFGKHKMSPILSPKKSVEGAIGGVAGAAILGAVYAAVVGKYLVNSGHTPAMYALFCAVGALISMVGDLAASGIKRNHDIKDYGHLIPGHGGILDRFDSVIFTAPIIYLLATIL